MTCVTPCTQLVVIPVRRVMTLFIHSSWFPVTFLSEKLPHSLTAAWHFGVWIPSLGALPIIASVSLMHIPCLFACIYESVSCVHAFFSTCLSTCVERAVCFVFCSIFVTTFLFSFFFFYRPWAWPCWKYTGSYTFSVSVKKMGEGWTEGASDIVKVKSSGEHSRATGGLVSNFSHPRVNKKSNTHLIDTGPMLRCLLMYTYPCSYA